MEKKPLELVFVGLVFCDLFVLDFDVAFGRNALHAGHFFLHLPLRNRSCPSALTEFNCPCATRLSVPAVRRASAAFNMSARFAEGEAGAADDPVVLAFFLLVLLVSM